MNLFEYKQNKEYPDRYSRDKRWVKILPVSGRPFQTAEFIELQSIIQDNIKQGFNTLFDNGAVLQGLKVSILSKGDTILELDITNGQCYIEGTVIDIVGTRLTIPTTGDFNIGLKFNESIITAEDDAGLRNPLKGGALYGTLGASRLIWEGSLVVNDLEAYTIVKIVDGNLITTDKSPFSKLDSLLEQYTYEKSGHFCVRGLEVKANIIEATSNESPQQIISLENNINNLEDTVQQTLSESNTLLNEVLNLREQVQQAEINVSISPTTGNQTTLVSLRNTLQQAEERYNRSTNLYLDRQKVLDSNKDNLKELKTNISDKVNIVVNPGVAYVLGKRISINYPFILNINKSLETATVDQAVFIYNGRPSQSIREIILNTTFASVIQNNTRIFLRFSSLKNRDSYITITVTINIPNNINTVAALINFIVAEFNKRFSNSPNPGINFSSTANLSQSNLRSIIKDNLNIYRSPSSNNEIIFESTNVSSTSNQINVISLIQKQVDQTYIEDTENLQFNITNSNLAGGGQTSEFILGQRPVKEIMSVVATLEENQKPIIRGSIPGTADNLSDDSIISITSVIQGNITYIEGQDYQLINQSQIDWSLTGAEPAPGTTYFVSFSYTQALVENIDYKLNRNTDSLEFIGKTPAPNKTFTVDYSYYLAKAASVVLDNKGMISVLLSSTSSKEPVPPTVSQDVLLLANLIIYANEVKVKKAECSPFTFKEVKNLVEQVKKNQINLENLKLENVAYKQAITEIGSNPIGSFNDNIQDFSKINLNNLSNNFSICPITQSFNLDYNYKDIPLKYISGGTLGKNNLDNNAYVFLPYTQRILLSQSRKTYSTTVIPKFYSSKGKLFIDTPLIFYNKDLKKLNPCDILVSKTNLASRVGTTSPIWLKSISDTIKTQFVDNGAQIINSLKYGLSLPSLGESDSFLNELFKIGTNSNYTLKVRVEDLIPNTQPYRIYIEGNLIKNALPAAPRYFSALQEFSFKSDAEGVIEVNIPLPNKLGYGTHLIEFIGSQGYAKSCISIFNNLANHIILGAISTWQETLPQINSDEFLPLITEEIVEQEFLISTDGTDIGVLPQIYNDSNNKDLEYPFKHDSLTQTFRVPVTSFITEVWLKFKKIGNPNEIKIYLKEASVGEPTKNVLGVAKTSFIEATSNGIIWSRFTFTHPIILKSEKEYCFSINTSNSEFEVFSSIIGEEDLQTNSIVGDQLYLKGSLFKSKDGVSLSIQPKEDLNFSLSQAIFSEKTTVLLGSYGFLDSFPTINAFTLNTRDVIPEGTYIDYQYRVTGGTWTPFKSNIVTCLEKVTSGLEIRAILSTTSFNLSPALLLKGSSISLYQLKDEATIISKPIVYPSNYSKVSIYLNTFQSTISNIRVYFSDVSNPTPNDWTLIPRSPSYKVNIDPGIGYAQYRYFFSGSSLGPTFSYKVEMDYDSTLTPPSIFNILSFVY